MFFAIIIKTVQMLSSLTEKDLLFIVTQREKFDEHISRKSMRSDQKRLQHPTSAAAPFNHCHFRKPLVNCSMLSLCPSAGVFCLWH